MKKIVTPENFMIVEVNLFLWALVLDKLHQKELALVVMAFLVGLMFFCMGFLLWDNKQELKKSIKAAKDLKKQMAIENQKRLEEDVWELKKQVAELRKETRNGITT